MRRFTFACLSWLLILCWLALLPGCKPSPAPETVSPRPQVSLPAPPAPAQEQVGALTVFAGAASKPALEQLAKVYEAKTGVKVDITFGGSGAVLTQFSQEQYGDVYVPGSDDFMDRAEEKQAVIPETRTVLVYLVPMICVAKSNPHGIEALSDLAQEGLRVVIGDVKAVCLGEIGRKMLESEGLWDKVEPRIISYAGNCEDVLNTLLLGESDAVIGWDAWPRQQPEKVEGIPLPEKIARPRNIPASVIKWSKQRDAAEAFIAFLTGEEAQATFDEHGYTLKPPGGGV